MRRIKYLFSTKALMLFASVLMAVALLLGSIGFTAHAATPANDGKFYSDFLSYDEMLAAGRDANAEIVSEGVTLLKNRQNVLPLKNVKRVSVFGKNGVDPYYHGFGAGAAQSTLDSISLYEGLEMAGYETNEVLKAFYENDARSGSDRTIGELIGEAPVDSYDAAVRRSFDRYNDAAIVCISRAVNEGQDAIRTYAHDQAEDPESSIERDRHYLELSKNEEEMIEYIKTLGFKKIIVLINSANAFEVAPLMADDAIDGLLWISSPGYDGFRAVGEILNGTVNPSGHLVDTWYSDFTKDPTWFNFGDNSQTSADGKTPNYQFRDAATGEPLEGVQFKEFVQYEEGIYVDYRYYETVYADMVASDGKEAADAWYAENVVFPFGYGMSYTDFAVTSVEASIPEGSDLLAHKDGKISFDVTVENVGDVAGKGVVQLYYHAPYYDGEIEKADEVLGAFAKTEMLAPGESDTLTLEVYIQDMASYDFEDKNGNGTKGYELDPGSYQFRINSDAHTSFAVKEGSNADVTFDYTISGEDAIYYPNDRITGQPVENRFDSTQEADGTQGLNNYNSLPDPVGSVGMTRMTRASSAHFVMPQAPTVEEASLEKTDSLYQKIVNAFYIGDLVEGDFRYRDADDAKATDGTTTVQFTQAASADDREIELTFPDMIGVESDDIKWEQFMNQLTWDELVQVVSQGRKMVVALPDFEMASAWLDNGPTCVSQVDYGSGNILAATWNLELADLMGSMVGEESLWIGRHGWYGPSVNIHRSAFGGRNNEYFSADPYLSGMMAARQIAAVQAKGVYVMAKHFALNEQETARSGIATYVDEQTMREIYLKPFQMAVEQGKALGIMSAMNKIGDTSSYACYALDTLILRGEWGFNGFIVTDSGPTATAPTPTTEDWPVAATFVNIWQQNISGNDLSLINTSAANLKYYGEWDDAKQTVVYTPDEGEPVETTSLWLAVRESAKRIIFANAQSCLSMNGVDTSGFAGTLEITVGKDVEFYETVAIEGELETDDIRYFVSEGALPEGVTLGSDGQISGIATEVGTYEFTVTLQADSWNQATKSVTLNVVTSSALTGMDDLTVGTAVDAAVGTDFIYKDYRRIGPIKAGIQLWWITLDYSFELYDGALPDGLSLSPDGKITGTPTAAGTYEFTINIAATEEASALQQYNTPVTPDYLTTFTVTVADGTGTAPGGDEEGETPDPNAGGTENGGAPLALGITGIAIGSVGLIVAVVAVILKRK